MNKPLINILILNWNNKIVLSECIQSIYKSDYSNFKITVVDNGSKDGTIAYINKLFDKVQFIKINKNLGYARGYNFAFKFLDKINDDSNWYLLLNNDTIINVNTLSRLVESTFIYGENNIFSPKIYNLDNKIWYAGARKNNINGNVYHIGINDDEKNIQYKTSQTDFVSGCCMFISKKNIQLLNGFNPIYKMYYEDSDLCLRAKRKNIFCYFISECSIYHHVSLSVGGRFSMIKYKSKLISFIKFLYNNNNFVFFIYYLLMNVLLTPYYLLLSFYKNLFYEKK